MTEIWELVNIFSLAETKNQGQEEDLVVVFILFFFRGREFIKDESGFKHVYYKTTLGHLYFAWNQD